MAEKLENSHFDILFVFRLKRAYHSFESVYLLFFGLIGQMYLRDRVGEKLSTERYVGICQLGKCPYFSVTMFCFN